MRQSILALLAIVFLSITPIKAEEAYISVAMPRNCILDNNAKSLLKNRLLNIVSMQGVQPTECSCIAIIPQVDILEENMVEGGMRNIYTIQLEVTLNIRNIITGSVFNTFQTTCSGNGYSKKEAILSAIRQINTNSSIFADYIIKGKENIISYYRDNLSAILMKANTLASQQQYDEALALLSTYPESLEGYSKVSNSIIDIYNRCQTQYGKQILLSAQAAYAQRDYATAAEIAASINSNCSCYPEAKELLSKIEKNITKEYNDQIALEREYIQSKERMQTRLIGAVRDIATAYFKRQKNYIYFW